MKERREMDSRRLLHNKNLSGKVAQFWDNWTIFSARLKIDIPAGNSARAEESLTRSLPIRKVETGTFCLFYEM